MSDKTMRKRLVANAKLFVSQSHSLEVEKNTYQLLELFEQKQAKCTFFTLGWVAERCPNLIKAIVEQGHELASHGYAHQRVTSMDQKQFREDVYKSKQLLEDAAGQAIIGYRAPSFSFNDSRPSRIASKAM